RRPHRAGRTRRKHVQGPNTPQPAQPQEHPARRRGGPGTGNVRDDDGRHRPGPAGHHREPGGHSRRVLLLVLDRLPGHGLDDPRLGRQLQLPVERGQQLGRRQGLEQRRPPDRELQRLGQPRQQRLPGTLRLDLQPAGGVLHRRIPRPVQPQQRGGDPRHLRLRRRHLHPTPLHALRRPVRGGHADVPAVLERPPEPPQLRHDRHRRALRRLVPCGDEPRQLRLLHDHGPRGRPEQRQRRHHGELTNPPAPEAVRPGPVRRHSASGDTTQGLAEISASPCVVRPCHWTTYTYIIYVYL